MIFPVVIKTMSKRTRNIIVGAFIVLIPLALLVIGVYKYFIQIPNPRDLSGIVFYEPVGFVVDAPYDIEGNMMSADSFGEIDNYQVNVDYDVKHVNIGSKSFPYESVWLRSYDNEEPYYAYNRDSEPIPGEDYEVYRSVIHLYPKTGIIHIFYYEHTVTKENDLWPWIEGEKKYKRSSGISRHTMYMPLEWVKKNAPQYLD